MTYYRSKLFTFLKIKVKITSTELGHEFELIKPLKTLSKIQIDNLLLQISTHNIIF